MVHEIQQVEKTKTVAALVRAANRKHKGCALHSGCAERGTQSLRPLVLVY